MKPIGHLASAWHVCCGSVFLKLIRMASPSSVYSNKVSSPPGSYDCAPVVSLAAVLTTCADRRGGCRTCWLAPRSSLAQVQPRECPPSLTSVCPVIHSSTSPITHSTRLVISCGRRCWPPTNPKPHPTSQRRWQHSIVTWYWACHRVHLLPPAGRPGFPLAGNGLRGLP
jgi:hypothetical protein